ncbi:LOW QUALITY PROTEIN: transposase, partial [Micromonospora sp. ATCC 39149]
MIGRRRGRWRVDWKYALGMELTEPGFDHSVLSEFRDRLAEGDRADRLLAVMVERLAGAGFMRARGRQRTDSTHVLAAVRRLSRVELVAETIRAALEALARVDEVWLPVSCRRSGRSGMAGRCVTSGSRPGRSPCASTCNRSVLTVSPCYGPSMARPPRRPGRGAARPAQTNPPPAVAPALASPAPARSDHHCRDTSTTRPTTT